MRLVIVRRTRKGKFPGRFFPVVYFDLLAASPTLTFPFSFSSLIPYPPDLTSATLNRVTVYNHGAGQPITSALMNGNRKQGGYQILYLQVSVEPCVCAGRIYNHGVLDTAKI